MLKFHKSIVSFRTGVNVKIPLLLLLTLILKLFFNTGILAIIVAAGMYLVMTVAYSKACVQIRKEKSSVKIFDKCCEKISTSLYCKSNKKAGAGIQNGYPVP